MTRASLFAATVTAAFLLFVPLVGAAAPSDLRLTAVQGSEFPARTFALSLPDNRTLRAGDVRVTESGASVADLSLKPACKASRRAFGVVLVLDTSLTMRGKPLRAAQAAEQSFAAQRCPNEQLGAINFNRTPTIVLPLTTDASKISAALATAPTVSFGTHIFDAVAQAEAMLKDAHISSGSIVLLSDGADRPGDTTTLEQVARVARKSHLRLYAIGLDDSVYKPGTLRAIAEAGNGEYVQAKANALAPLFAQLGRVLSNEYLLSYRSLLGPGVRANVNVDVRTVGTATAVYGTPRLARGTPGGTGTSIGAGILTSPVTMVILALLIAAMFAIFIIVLLQPRRTRLPGRISEFVSIPELQRDRRATTAVPLAVGESAVRKDWWTRLREALEIARISVDPEVLIVGTGIATVLVFVLIFAATGSAWWALLALLVPYLVRESVIRALKKQRSRFAEQLPDALQVIASALRAGHSLAGSLAVVVESASDPMRSELQRVVADEQLGIPIQRSLAVVAERMASSDVEQLALVAELQRQAGGDTAEVVDRVAETVRERFDLKRLVETLTTQGRMSRWIVSALPIVILLVLQFENPHYFQPLIASTSGRVIVGVAAVWAVIGSLIIKRIVEIEV